MSEDLEVIKLQVDAWKTVVDVQEHFNDIEMRIRALFLTLVGVLLTVSSGFAEHTASTQQPQVAANIATSYTMTIVLTLCFVFALLFWYMDRFWYHVYLRGAVDSGERLEKLIEAKVPGIDLTQSITKSSHDKHIGRRRTTGNRLTLFYGAIAYLSGGGAIVTRTSSNTCVWVSILAFGVVLLLVWLFGNDNT